MAIKTSNTNLAIEFIAYMISNGFNAWGEDFHEYFRDFLLHVYQIPLIESEKHFTDARLETVRTLVYMEYDRHYFIHLVVTNGFSTVWQEAFKSMNKDIY